MADLAAENSTLSNGNGIIMSTSGPIKVTQSNRKALLRASEEMVAQARLNTIAKDHRSMGSMLDDRMLFRLEDPKRKGKKAAKVEIRQRQEGRRGGKGESSIQKAAEQAMEIFKEQGINLTMHTGNYAMEEQIWNEKSAHAAYTQKRRFQHPDLEAFKDSLTAAQRNMFKERIKQALVNLSEKFRSECRVLKADMDRSGIFHPEANAHRVHCIYLMKLYKGISSDNLEDPILRAMREEIAEACRQEAAVSAQKAALLKQMEAAEAARKAALYGPTDAGGGGGGGDGGNDDAASVAAAAAKALIDTSAVGQKEGTTDGTGFEPAVNKALSRSASRSRGASRRGSRAALPTTTTAATTATTTTTKEDAAPATNTAAPAPVVKISAEAEAKAAAAANQARAAPGVGAPSPKDIAAKTETASSTPSGAAAPKRQNSRPKLAPLSSSPKANTAGKMKAGGGGGNVSGADTSNMRRSNTLPSLQSKDKQNRKSPGPEPVAAGKPGTKSLSRSRTEGVGKVTDPQPAHSPVKANASASPSHAAGAGAVGGTHALGRSATGLRNTGTGAGAGAGMLTQGSTMLAVGGCSSSSVVGAGQSLVLSPEQRARITDKEKADKIFKKIKRDKLGAADPALLLTSEAEKLESGETFTVSKQKDRTSLLESETATWMLSSVQKNQISRTAVGTAMLAAGGLSDSTPKGGAGALKARLVAPSPLVAEFHESLKKQQGSGGGQGGSDNHHNRSSGAGSPQKMLHFNEFYEMFETFTHERQRAADALAAREAAEAAAAAAAATAAALNSLPGTPGGGQLLMDSPSGRSLSRSRGDRVEGRQSRSGRGQRQGRDRTGSAAGHRGGGRDVGGEPTSTSFRAGTETETGDPGTGDPGTGDTGTGDTGPAKSGVMFADGDNLLDAGPSMDTLSVGLAAAVGLSASSFDQQEMLNASSAVGDASAGVTEPSPHQQQHQQQPPPPQKQQQHKQLRVDLMKTLASTDPNFETFLKIADTLSPEELAKEAAQRGMGASGGSNMNIKGHSQEQLMNLSGPAQAMRTRYASKLTKPRQMRKANPLGQDAVNLLDSRGRQSRAASKGFNNLFQAPSTMKKRGEADSCGSDDEESLHPDDILGRLGKLQEDIDEQSASSVGEGNSIGAPSPIGKPKNAQLAMEANLVFPSTKDPSKNGARPSFKDFKLQQQQHQQQSSRPGTADSQHMENNSNSNNNNNSRGASRSRSRGRSGSSISGGTAGSAAGSGGAGGARQALLMEEEEVFEIPPIEEGASMQDKLMCAWEALAVPAGGRLTFMRKYSDVDHSIEMPLAVDLWSQAAVYVVAILEMLKLLAKVKAGNCIMPLTSTGVVSRLRRKISPLLASASATFIPSSLGYYDAHQPQQMEPLSATAVRRAEKIVDKSFHSHYKLESKLVHGHKSVHKLTTSSSGGGRGDGGASDGMGKRHSHHGGSSSSYSGKLINYEVSDLKAAADILLHALSMFMKELRDCIRTAQEELGDIITYGNKWCKEWLFELGLTSGIKAAETRDGE